MALLAARGFGQAPSLPAGPLWLCLALAGCSSQSSLGKVELELFDRPVLCDAARNICLPAGGTGPAVPELSWHETFVSRGASRYGEAGIYLYFEIPRVAGAVAHVELDFPTGSGVGGPAGGPFLSYREYLGDRLVFRSTAVHGRIEVPAHQTSHGGPVCDCEDGRFELVFTAPGADGQTGTEDDQVRRVSRGRYSWDSDFFCRAAKLMDVSPELIDIAALYECPYPVPSSSGSSGGGSYGGSYETDVGCEAEDDGYYEDTGCDGDTSDDYGSSSDYGCEGDSSDYGSSSDVGCEGDSSDYGSSADIGCDGGSAGAASCEGDALAALHPPRRSRGRARIVSTALPFALLALFATALRRRGRR
jgi:hypothetical protein